MAKGVPVGYRIPGWKYTGRWKEKKIGRDKRGRGKWSFTFVATKRRKAKGYGSHPKGRTVTWGIRAKQRIVKTRPGEYQTFMKGTKRMLRSGRKR